MRKPPRKNNPASLSDPMPVRFTEDEEATLRALKEQTGMNLAELIRRAVRFAAPKFLSGEINVATMQARVATGAAK